MFEHVHIRAVSMDYVARPHWLACEINVENSGAWSVYMRYICATKFSIGIDHRLCIKGYVEACKCVSIHRHWYKYDRL